MHLILNRTLGENPYLFLIHGLKVRAMDVFAIA
jgi:hypothetical protein